jgi:RNA polymerase sigma-70 factor (sigma-E family)
VRAPEDFTDWLLAQRTALLRSATLLTGDPGLAEDLVQEAAVKVAARWERLRDEHPTAYARRIVFRDHASWWRRRRELPAGAPGEVARDRAAPPARDTEGRHVVLAALATLPRGQRAVVVLRYFDDLTERQTAEVLGVSVGTVKSQAHTALGRLRDHPDLRGLVGKETLR